MTQARNVTATFTPQYTLTVAKVGSGTVTSSPAGINCGSTCSEVVTSGSTVTLSATPATGFVFSGWSGGGCTGAGNCTVNVTANTTVTATFTQQFVLTVTKVGSGTVTSSPSGINCGASCNAPFNSGTSVTLTATPTGGYGFTGWSGTGINCPGTGTCTVSMTQARTVTASFAQLVTLTIGKDGDGAGTVTGGNMNCGNACTQSVLPGTMITLSATPSSANATLSTFTGFTGGNGCNTTADTCTVTVTGNMTITASFTLKPTIMFVTSKTYQGDFGGVDQADQICQGLAQDAQRPGTYRAYLSYSTSTTTHVSADERFANVSGWVLVNGEKVMQTSDQMWKGVLTAPSRTEKDEDVAQSQEVTVWTGTYYTGVWWGHECAPQGQFGPWTYLPGDGGVGVATATDNSVVYDRYRACDSAQRLYCLGVDRKARVQ